MPMLSTFGGGSIRGFTSGAGGPDLGYVDWGGGTPSFTASSTYTNISGIAGHYGMVTDSFNRYAILTSRGYSNLGGPPYYNIWIPITSSGLDISNKFNVYYPGVLPEENSFGGMADTVRGIWWQFQFSNNKQTPYNLPSVLSGLSAGETPTVSGNQNMTSSGYSSTSINVGGNDGGYHDGWNDTYWYAGRGSTTVAYGAASPTISSTSNYNIGSQQIYGVCIDPSSGWLFGSARNQGFYMWQSSGSSVNTTYANSANSNLNSVEDCIVGWTGDVYLFKSSSDNSSISMQRFERTG